MNELFLSFPHDHDPSILVTSATRLLDTGAEFTKLSTSRHMAWSSDASPLYFGLARFANSADVVDGKLTPVQNRVLI